MPVIQLKSLGAIQEAADQFVAQMGSSKVFAFSGKMGVGKTTLIKAICERLGVTDVINSPTFSIVNEYHSGAIAPLIYHFDFYRIKDIREACHLGVEDYFESGALCFIEWPDKVEALLPSDAVIVTMEEQEDGCRLIHFPSDIR